ncbi:hypothetical protein AGLY_005613 [Aphis glycines]|uniref:Uncharacterized protein n=1 Tax=Aphis glycines TaxID=307491 RepID=A0A6G0TTT1_APHGL|nr:hypothetical protein AGLY_005613 [Aphis glycines]
MGKNGCNDPNGVITISNSFNERSELMRVEELLELNVVYICSIIRSVTNGFLVYTNMSVEITTSTVPNCEISAYGRGWRCTSVIRHHSGIPIINIQHIITIIFFINYFPNFIIADIIFQCFNSIVKDVEMSKISGFVFNFLNVHNHLLFITLKNVFFEHLSSFMNCKLFTQTVNALLHFQALEFVVFCFSVESN